MEHASVLLLNQSEEILGVRPINRAVRLLMKGKAKAPYGFDDFHDVPTATGIMKVPTALVMAYYVRVPHRNVPCTKVNILRRDGYECLATGTLVQMENYEWKPIHDVEIGDTVRTATGYGRVTMKRGKKTDKHCVAVKPYYGLPVTMTRDHLCMTEKNGELSFVKAEDLSGKKMVWPVGAGDEEMDDNLLRLLGYYCAEGCVDRKDGKAYCTVFTIGPEEDVLAQSIKDAVNKVFGITRSEDNVRTDSRNGNTFRFIRFCSRKMSEFLSSKVPGKANKKVLSFDVENLSERCTKVLVEAMMHGDGCDTKCRDSDVRILTTASVSLALQTQRMLWRTGIFASIVQGKQVEGAWGEGNRYYHVQWFPTTKRHLGKFVTINGLKYLSVPVQYVKPSRYAGRVWDISVDSEDDLGMSFVTPGGIVHNCQYCGTKLTNATGTVDHVMPQSRGGKHTWSNVVAACRKCNGKKDNRTPSEAGMKLRCMPYVPRHDLMSIHAIGKRGSWKRWLFT